MSSEPNAPEASGPVQKDPRMVYRDRNAPVPPSQRLEDDERHPVLIFGSAEAGKSTLIMSMINALEKSGKDDSVGVDVSFGNSFYERRDAKTETQLFHARTFFEASSTNYILGREALGTTQVDFPFFIPLDLRIKGSLLKPVKIAIMDGRGEWYEPRREAGAGTFKEFDEDIVEVLKNYSRGISIICVAPYSRGDKDENDVQNSDSGLWAALKKYCDTRPDSDDDSLLFLMTKWDQAANPDRSSDFSCLEGAQVVDIVDRRYERSWNVFRNIRVGGDDWDKRCFMQYSSCKFIEGKPKVPRHLERQFLRYPRTVLNWIYGNARRFEFSVGRNATELPLNLFPDVVPSRTKMIPLSERFLRRIVG